MLARARAETEALEARAADAEASEAAAAAELRGAEAAAAERDAAVARAEALEQRVADLRAEQALPCSRACCACWLVQADQDFTLSKASACACSGARASQCPRVSDPTQPCADLQLAGWRVLVQHAKGRG